MQVEGGAQVDVKFLEPLVAAQQVPRLHVLLSRPSVKLLLSSGRCFSTPEFAAVSGVSQSTALRYIGLLIKEGCLQRTGKGPHTRYQSAGGLPGVSSSGEAVREKLSSPAEDEQSCRVDGHALDELLLRQKGVFSAKEVALQANVHVSTVLRHIQRLCAEEVLMMVGAGPKTQYQVRVSGEPRARFKRGAQRASTRREEERQNVPSPEPPAQKRTRLATLLESLSDGTSVKALVAKTSVPRRTLQRYLVELQTHGIAWAEGFTRARRYGLREKRPSLAAAQHSPHSLPG
jgi:Fic family protein